MRKFSRILLGCAAVAASVVPAHAALVISSDPTSNVTCGAGVCSATAADAVLNAGDLALALAHGDLNVESGSDAMDIDVTTSLSWTTHHTLTLTADRSIAVSAAMVAEGTGARVVLVTGSGGDLTFTSSGELDFWSTHSHLTINGTAYTLVADLSGLATAVATRPARAYALAQSYDAGPDGTYARAPVTTAFTGTFEGLGHSVSNLTISSTDSNVGLFAVVPTGAVMRDIALTNASVVGTPANNQYVGALVGNGSSMTVSHVVVSGTVSGYVAGGLAGQFSGKLTDAGSSAVVTATSYGGGLVGSMTHTTLTFGRASGAVSGAGAGGLVGYAEGDIIDSFATGNVTTTQWGGGLVAYFDFGGVLTSYATGNVSSTASSKYSATGGLLGFIDGVSVGDAYALGDVSQGPAGFVGGLIGEGIEAAYIEQSYAAGTVSGGQAHQFGGFAGGFGNAVLSGNFWDVTTGGAIPKHGIGKCLGEGCKTTVDLTTTQFQSGLPSGFNASVWGLNPGFNGGFPYLLALPPS
jgi:The GLUG motif